MHARTSGVLDRTQGVRLHDSSPCRLSITSTSGESSTTPSQASARRRPLHMMAAPAVAVLFHSALLLNSQDPVVMAASFETSLRSPFSSVSSAAAFGSMTTLPSLTVPFAGGQQKKISRIRSSQSRTLREQGQHQPLRMKIISDALSEEEVSTGIEQRAQHEQRRQSQTVRTISDGLSEEEVSTDIEYAAHDDSDKIMQMDSLLGGSINITSIEDIDSELGISASNGAKVEYRHEEKQRIIKPKMWKRRHARSAEEGIRSETETGKELSTLLQKASSVSAQGTTGKRKTNMARTIAGLVVALAEEAEDLEVEVDARRDTPLSGKHVDSIRINFSKLGFAPLRMGGLDQVIREFEADLDPDEKDIISRNISSETVYCVDEAFDRIDVDNSGALDEEELTNALVGAAKVQSRKAKEVMSGLASRLIRLYDTDGNGLYRQEYQNMVEDMSALREAKQEQTEEKEEKEEAERNLLARKAWWRPRQILRSVFPRRDSEDVEASSKDDNAVLVAKTPVEDLVTPQPKANGKRLDATNETGFDIASSVDISGDSAFLPSTTKEGSIILSDLKLDLWRLLFGLVPGLKKITPGGPLVLEPFTMTVNAQFSREDILRSTLLNRGLRLLVERVLKKRVRPIRDLLDGAVFFGRKWNLASKTAPLTEVVELSDIEWTKDNKFIFTGRVRVRASPESPTIENSFKLRARLGTWDGGKYIGIIDPELALILECPKAWERNIHTTFRRFKLGVPKRPRPLYTYFPLPLKEKTGYYLGEDNMIKSIYIKDEALKFEISAVVRPGRFLGSHYIAFTVPQRTYIITVERIREGMRVARRNKLAADAAKETLRKASRQKILESYDKLLAESISDGELPDELIDAQKQGVISVKEYLAQQIEEPPAVPPDPFADRPGFFGRFVEGYLGASGGAQDTEDDELLNERLASAISDWFGRQGKIERRGGGLMDRARQELSDAYYMNFPDVREEGDDEEEESYDRYGY